MSAWMHGNEHIDLIVSAAREAGLGYTTQAEADALGKMLLAENAASVNYRYDIAPTDPEAKDYARQVKGYTFTPVDLDALPDWTSGVAKALSSYAYQSCEHEGWETSQARTVTDDLTTALIARGATDADALVWWSWTREEAGLTLATA